MNQYPAGTLNLAAIQDTLYDWVKDVTQGVLDQEVQIIWRNQSEPLPARPCVTLKLIDGPRPIARQGNVFQNAANEPQTVGIQMEATLSIQVFGNTHIHRPMALQLAMDINSSLLRQTVLDELKSGGVAVQELGKPQNLTALEESEYEERSGFEVTLGLVQNLTDQPGKITQVNISKTVDGNETSQTVNLS